MVIKKRVLRLFVLSGHLRLDGNCDIDRDRKMRLGCVVLDRERYKVGIFIMREEHFHKEQDYIHQYD